MQLISVSALKLHLGIDTDDQDDRLKSLIEGVSERVQLHCGRSFELSTRYTWLDGNDDDTLLLPDWPIVNLYGVSLSRTYGMEVSFSGGSFASCTVDAAGVTLTSLNSTTGVQTDTPLAFSTYKTLSLLASQINATAGWTATVFSDCGSSSSYLLRPVTGGSALSPTRLYLEVTVEPFEDAARVHETNRAIRMVSGGSFPEGRNNVLVWYRAGYTLPTEQSENSTVPDGLKLATLEIAADVYRMSVGDATKSVESIGDHRWEWNSDKVKSVVEAHGASLMPFRRLSI